MTPPAAATARPIMKAMTRNIMESFSLEGGLALFEEGFDALVLVLTGKAEREEVYFAAQALVQIRARGDLDSLLSHAQRDGALLADAVRHLHRLAFEVFGWHDHIDQAQAKRRARVNDIAGQDKLHRFAFTDETGEALRAAAAGYNAEVDFRLTEGGRLAG